MTASYFSRRWLESLLSPRPPESALGFAPPPHGGMIERWLSRALWESLPNASPGKRGRKPGGSPEDSRALILKPALEENCNELGHVEAGHLLKLMDVVGVVSAFRHFNEGNIFVTASLDRTNFVSPIHAWEYIRMDSRITQVWGSSLETEVTLSAFGLRDRETVRHDVATAYLTYVALDERRHKVTLPPLSLGRASDYRAARLADLRRENRRQEASEARRWRSMPLTILLSAIFLA